MSTYPVIKGFETSTCAGEHFIDLWNACLNKKSFINSSGLGEVISNTYTNKGNPIAPMAYCIEKAIASTSDKSWDEMRSEIGIILATTTGHTAAWEDSLMTYLKADVTNIVEFTECFFKEPLGRLLDDIKEKTRVSGPSLVISTACSASTHALGVARAWIKRKKVKRCIVVSTELLCLLTTEGFKSFNLLSKNACTPFDKDRNGINLSEAFGCICIEGQNSVDSDEVYLAGFGASTDTYQMTTPDPEGTGTTASIKMALQQADIHSDRIKLIHCHGTASIYNDLAESKAIHNIWPAKESRPLVTSTKGVHGHALGASGLIETCIATKAMTESICPPTTGFKNPDPELKIVPVLNSTPANLDCIVKNTLGFGGANASIVLQRGHK